MRLDAFKIACSGCSLRELCMPAQLSEAELQRIDGLVARRQRLPKGGTLFATGSTFEALYAVRSGTFKTCVLGADGHEQVLGFQMAGEILGLDGIVEDRHNCQAVALESAEVCTLPMAELNALSLEIPSLQRHLQRIMSREIVRDHGVMQLLGSMRAEERVAAFLVNLVQRLAARGFSDTELVLRMTREEIGSYLGLKLETVSRAFSRLVELGVISVRGRQVAIREPQALRRLARACH